MICLCLTASQLAQNYELVKKYRGRFDLAELRVDCLHSITPHTLEEIAQFPQRLDEICGAEAILTVRRRSDGGYFNGDERARFDIFHAIAHSAHDRKENGENGAAAQFAYIDLEIDVRGTAEGDAIGESFCRLGAQIIRSRHEIEGTIEGGSEGIAHALRELMESPQELPKLAIFPHSTAEFADFVEGVLSTEQKSGPHRIVIAMGEFGIPSRILTPHLGSRWTYVSPKTAPATTAVAATAGATTVTTAATAAGAAAATTAPPTAASAAILHGAQGQLSIDDLHEIYHYRSLDTHSAIFGVIGNPIAHSKSPRFHNRIFREARHNAVLLPFLCDDVPQFFRLARLLHIAGFAVTIPHKCTVLDMLDMRLSPDRGRTLHAIGACNTVYAQGDRWGGENTDITGFLAPLSHVQQSADNPRALIIGAGGAARAIIYALCKERWHIHIINRTLENAQRLTKELIDRYPEWEPQIRCEALPLFDPAAHPHFDLIVQTTNIGMSPHTEADPLPQYRFDGSEIVYDIIYTPAETRFLHRAHEAGCTTIGGDKMFIAQAEAQSKIFIAAL